MRSARGISLGAELDARKAYEWGWAVLARGSASGAAYYASPSEDFTRPGRTWWPLGPLGLDSLVDELARV